MLSKKLRQGKIREVIRREEILNQQELQKQLELSGFEVTQATLSRDIRELGLVKGPKGYQENGEKQPLASEEQLRHLMREFLADIKASGNLVLLKTQQGCAQTVAIALDRMAWPEVAGTLAGDDTILAVVAEGYRSQDVRKRIQSLIN